MPTGSCVCGDFTYEYTGQPESVVICHCEPCRKLMGSNGSVNLMIPKDKLQKKSGKVFQHVRKGDSGKNVTNNNCATCGTIMIVELEANPDIKIVKSGTVDDHEVDNANKPTAEIYTKYRPTWCTAWPVRQAQSAT